MFIVKSAVKKTYGLDFDGRSREVCAIMADSRGVVPDLPKHSYWFDFWMFLLFDVILFLIFYFVLP
uniref:Uncharacterized protein n=1 Tax=Sinocyclocheilus anshuiensis TaxID=1608454 RepID=A0A671MHE1_9TELE